jgi:hypothetical protein
LEVGMHRSITVLLERREQPEDEVWRRANDLVHDLSEQGIPPVSTTPDVAVSYSFPTDDDERCRRLIAELERAHGEWGLAWRDRRVRHVDPDDFSSADLLVVEGVCLDDGFGRFLLNPTEAIGAAESCPNCDARGPRARPVVAPPRVDENRLRRHAELPVLGRAEVQTVAPREQWDLVTLQNSAVVASRRLVDALEQFGARGWTTAPVLDAKGRETTDLVLLGATTVGASPCLPHSGLDESTRCDGCGRVQAKGAGSLLTVRRQEFSDVDVTSVGPLAHGPLVFRRELVDRLVADGIAGIVPAEPRMFCDD